MQHLILAIIQFKWTCIERTNFWHRLIFISHLTYLTIYKVSTHLDKNKKILVKLFDIAVTSKYGQSRSQKVVWTVNTQWMLPSCKVQHLSLLSVWENPNGKVFDKSRHFTNQKHVNYLQWTHNGITWIILCMICLINNHTAFELLTTEDKYPRKAICSTFFWHTCALLTKSKSSNLNSRYKTQARL